MTYRIGSGYLGSPNIETSVANAEIIPAKPSNWTVGYKFYKFSFLNQSACHVSINGGNQIYLSENQGFTITEVDQPIESFKVIEGNIKYQWLGAYG
jgi:hypothetical protein